MNKTEAGYSNPNENNVIVSKEKEIDYKAFEAALANLHLAQTAFFKIFVTAENLRLADANWANK